MQNQKYSLKDVTLIPVPWELLDEIDLDPETDDIQFSVSRGRIVMEPVDADQDLACHGRCCYDARLNCAKLQCSLYR